MKKKILIIIIILLIFIILYGMISYAVNKLKTKNTPWNMESDNSLGKENAYPVFYGKVIDTLGIYEEIAWVEPPPGPVQITIEPEENEEIRKSADKIVVYLKEDDGNVYELGTRIKVTYSGEVRETYPAQVDCISIEEIENKTINMYKKILEDLIKEDSVLNENARFIAIDFENFLTHHKDRYSKEDQLRSLSQSEKQALLDFCKQYNENVIEASFEELKDQGYFNEETRSLDGILITVDNTETIKGNKAILRMSKYRSALGAIMPKYEVDLINDYYWNLKVIDTMIS